MCGPQSVPGVPDDFRPQGRASGRNQDLDTWNRELLSNNCRAKVGLVADQQVRLPVCKETLISLNPTSRNLADVVVLHCGVFMCLIRFNERLPPLRNPGGAVSGDHVESLLRQSGQITLITGETNSVTGVEQRFGHWNHGLAVTGSADKGEQDTHDQTQPLPGRADRALRRVSRLGGKRTLGAILITEAEGPTVLAALRLRDCYGVA